MKHLIIKKFGNVNHCTNNLTDSNSIDQKKKTPAQRYFQTTAMTITKIIYIIQNFDHQIKSICIDIDSILKELDVEYNNEQHVSKAIINIKSKKVYHGISWCLTVYHDPISHWKFFFGK